MRQRVQRQCCTCGRTRPARPRQLAGVYMGDEPARRFLCARCRAPMLVCSHCDRGQIYCATGCAAAARQHSQREAGRRYQGSLRGRFRHAARTRRWRERQALQAESGGPPEMARPQSVTHQGSPAPTSDAVLVAVPSTVAATVAPAAAAPPIQPCKTVSTAVSAAVSVAVTAAVTAAVSTSNATTPAAWPLALSAWRCHWCHRPSAARVRLDFLRHSRSARPRRRASARGEPSHGHSP